MLTKRIRRIICHAGIRTLIFLSLLFYFPLKYSYGQSTNFTSSNLPIIVIETHGQTIPLDNPRIIADMGITYNGPGVRNYTTDTFNIYSGKISIEIHGSSTAGWTKKSYSLETENADGSNNNVSLLDMPAENDWILYAPYYDRSLMRDVLVYDLAREMGWYASRTRYCELVLNNKYQGLYILMEKIKRDKNRVDISKLKPDEISGDNVTGGYIIKIDKEAWKHGFDSKYKPYPGATQTIRYQYWYPDKNNIVPEQEDYISHYVWNFEDVMAGDDYADREYPAYMNVHSFVDYFIINELSKNVDGYRLSSYLYKDRDSKGGKLTAGPVWDYNFSFGNVAYDDAQYYTGWELFYLTQNDGLVPFWWRKLIHDSVFVQQIIQRWHDLRKDLITRDHLDGFIDTVADTLAEAKDRNFSRWIGPGDPKLPTDGWFPPSDPIDTLHTYADEIYYLKYWIDKRIQWIDGNIDLLLTTVTPPGSRLYGFRLKQNVPNPVNDETTIAYEIPEQLHVQINVYNLLGQKVTTLLDKEQSRGEHHIQWIPHGVANGIYIYEIRAGNFRAAKKLLLQK